MLLAIDMGNTQTAMGLFDGDELVQSWRMPTDRSYTADEIHVRLMGFFKMYGLSLDAVDAIAFAGVVPQLSRSGTPWPTALPQTPSSSGRRRPP